MMENYFWNTENTLEHKKVFVLVIYDIIDNKRRNRFAKTMNGYGSRVQKSAFEALLTVAVYKKLIKEIPKLINGKEDSVRVYKLSGYGEISLFGVNTTIRDEDVIIV